MELARRDEVPVELTWDLSLIYPTLEEWQADFDAVKKMADDIEAHFKGRLTDAQTIADCLAHMEELEKKAFLVGSYTSLAASVDYYNTENQERDGRTGAMMAQIMSKLTFIDSEILLQSDEVIEGAIELSKGGKNYLRDLFVGFFGSLPTIAGVLLTLFLIFAPQAVIALIIIACVKKSKKKKAARAAANAAPQAPQQPNNQQ